MTAMADPARCVDPSLGADSMREALLACASNTVPVTLARSDVAGVPIYAAADLLRADRRQVFDELVAVLRRGAGVFVVESAVAAEAVRRVSLAFDAIIERERSAAAPAGDHFAPAGANSRIWNALEKLADADPEAFCEYYESPAIALAAEAWLGPWYQVTSQVNVVHPGGAAQQPHCDFHLGFQYDADIARFPAHVHALSPMLTLQGAVAHCDMPVATGPTTYLPHSQKLPAVYSSWRRADLIAAYSEMSVSIPLRLGDAVFFNPSLLHAAGTNQTTDVHRMANLLQISSAMGRAMESVDRAHMSRVLFRTLCARRDAGWSAEALSRVVAASSEGYPFPTNLDRDQPIGRLTPASQAEVVLDALLSGADSIELTAALVDHDQRRRTR